MQGKLGISFNDIYTEYYRKSYLYVKSYVHISAVAEDIVSESLIKLWEQIKMDSIDKVAPVLFTILKNRSLDYLKHQKVKEKAHELIKKALAYELEIRTATLKSSDPDTIFSNEVNHIVEETLNSLPRKTKDIFVLSRFENKSHKEIAVLYNISVKGVDYHIMKSVRQLRHSLKDYLPLLGVISFLRL